MPLSLDSLNPAQRQAATHVEGPLLVLAGPGSGKTRVVTHRVAHLLEQGVSAQRILALTFTNKAADEMARRIGEMAPGTPVWVSTFHRFAARLLRQYASLVGLSPNYTIYDASDARQTLKRVIDAGDFLTLHYSPERIAAAISKAKNRLITPERYETKVGSPISRVVAEIYPAYQKRLLASSAVDFDDLLMLTAGLLTSNPEVRRDLDARYQYIMVDEYQDTNHAQYVLLRALSVEHPNLAVTGDPDQSIYGWRGADIANILQFERDYPGVAVVRLEQNYRSTPNILRVADQLITFNEQRKHKTLTTDNPAGAAVRLVKYADETAESRGIADQIKAAIDSGERRPRDFAIFYRINALSRSLEQALHLAGVPFQMVRGQEFYQRKEIKDVLAYCQLINNPLDDQAVLRSINTPTRGIGRKTVDTVAELAYVQGLSLLEAARTAADSKELAGRARKALASYVAIIDRLNERAGAPVEEILGAVLEETSYRESLEGSESEEDLNRLANIEELLTAARQFDDRDQEGGGLEAYLENAWLVNETDNLDTDVDKVTLMTLHAAKGLEFPVVYLMAVEHGLLPHERSINDPAQMEEERRLAFVGITRAEDELQLSYATRRDFRGQRRLTVPSQFLMEIPRDEMEMVNAGQSADGYAFEPWEQDNLYDEQLPDEYDDAAQSEAEDAEDGVPLGTIPPAAITTGAQLAGRTRRLSPHVDPETFAQGMRVSHPEHGPGKIVALSGAGKNRRATVRFATAGEKKFILQHSNLRPA